MKPGKQPPKESTVKKALLGVYGVVGLSVSTFGGFKVPFAEANAKDYWRHALAGIILVIALVAGIVSLALYLFDANYFKSQMVDYVKVHNQRDLTLDGDIKITFFPKLGLDAGKMSISQRNSSKNFASVENARFYIAWWPLLRKQLQIEHVELDGVHANITRYKDGSSNLDDLFTNDVSMGDIKFDIDSILLKNASANLSDEPTGLLFSMHDMQIETGRLTDAIPGTVSASFRLESSQPHIDAKVKLNSHMLFELKSNHYEFANFEGEMEGEAAGLNNVSAGFQGSLSTYPALGNINLDKFVAHAKAKLDQRKLDLKLELPKLQLRNKKLSGSDLTFNATLLQEDENLSASLEIPQFDISEKKLQSANVTANFDLFKSGGALQGKLSSALAIDFSAQQLQLNTISAGISASHPVFSGKLAGTLNGDLQFNLAEQHAQLNFKAKIDDSNLLGNVALQDFTHPAYSFELGANTLDADRYLATDWSKRLQEDAQPFDLKWLNGLTLHGKFRSNEFKFAKLKLHSLLAEIKIDQAGLLIEPLSARLYAGNSSGSLGIGTGDMPQFSFRQKLNNVQLNELLADSSGTDAKLSGKGNLSFDLNANGNSPGALRKTVNGSASLALGHGSIAGLNLGDALLAGKNQLGIKDAELAEAAKFSQSTAFNEFKCTFEIKDGKASSSDVLLKSALFSGKGSGDIMLDSGTLNYQLNTAVAGNVKRSQGELAELKGINIPVRISGPGSNPTIVLELGNASGGNIGKASKDISAAEKKSGKPAKKSGASGSKS